MNPDEFTLSNICSSGLERFKQTGHAKEFLTSQREHLPGGPVPWPKIEQMIGEKLTRLLDINLRDIWLAAWQECQELHKLADPEKYDPKEEISVPLSEHEIVSEHHPALEISVAGVKVHRIVFELTATLKMEGCELTVKDRRIVKWLVGSCKGGVELAWNKKVLIETETDRISLIGPREIKPGIPLSLEAAQNTDARRSKRRSESH